MAAMDRFHVIENPLYGPEKAYEDATLTLARIKAEIEAIDFDQPATSSLTNPSQH